MSNPTPTAVRCSCGFDPRAEKNHRPWCRVFSAPAPERPTADTITPDQLDALYDQLEDDAAQHDRAMKTAARERESYRQAWKYEQRRRATAEARVRTLESVAEGNKRHVQLIVPDLERAEAAVARVSALADRWQAAQGPSMSLVRAAGAELREVLAGEVQRCGECMRQHPGEDFCVDPEQLPPNQGPLSGIEVRDPCPHCENRLVPRRQMIAHIREQHPGGICDFPLGWRVAQAYTFDEHDPKCSYTQTRGALLCDCHVLFPEQRRGGPGIPVPDADCTFCPDGHQDPTGGSQPWSAWVGPARDGDGQPTTIHVARSAGAHVAESDAQWVRQVLNASPEAFCDLPHEMEV